MSKNIAGVLLAILIITANTWLYILNIQDGDTFFAIVLALGVVCGLIVLALEALKWIVAIARSNRGE